jgi:hypothetical protein
MLLGAVRHAPPLAAFARLLGVGREPASEPSGDGTVFAPSLGTES